MPELNAARQDPTANAGLDDAFVTKLFPEYDMYAPYECRWPHTRGATTTLNYHYSSDPALQPGQPWRNAYTTALGNWNTAATRMRFAELASSSITFGLYFDNTVGHPVGRNIPTCNGST